MKGSAGRHLVFTGRHLDLEKKNFFEMVKQGKQYHSHRQSICLEPDTEMPGYGQPVELCLLFYDVFKESGPGCLKGGCTCNPIYQINHYILLSSL